MVAGKGQTAFVTPRRVLLLSTTTGYQLRAFGESAGRLGIELVFATDRCLTLDDPWHDAAVPVRFHEPRASLDGIRRAAREKPIHGVLPVGDRPVVLAALAAEVLGLPGNAPDAANASANKLLARRRFAAAGLPVPWHVELRTTTDPRAAALRARYPAVVKPIGLSGSRGVIRADTPEALERAVQRVYALLTRKDIRAMRAGLESEILIEGFIEGREYAVEGVLTDGELQVFAIFDKPDPLDGPFFEETIYVTPSMLTAMEQRAIVDQVQRGTRALGLRHGPVHAECRVGPDGIFLLEIAARPIGGLCSQILRFDRGQPPFRRGQPPFRAQKVQSLAAEKRGQPPFCENGQEKGGSPLEEILLRHAVGEDVSGYTREARAAAVMMVPIPKRGLLREVRGEADARTVPGVEDIRITAKTDQLLEPLPEAGAYLGFIFARAARAEDAEAAVREAHRRLTFVVDSAIDVQAV
jgi:hypothetical protein